MEKYADFKIDASNMFYRVGTGITNTKNMCPTTRRNFSQLLLKVQQVSNMNEDRKALHNSRWDESNHSVRDWVT